MDNPIDSASSNSLVVDGTALARKITARQPARVQRGARVSFSKNKVSQGPMRAA
jgi:hypothetical protein